MLLKLDFDFEYLATHKVTQGTFMERFSLKSADGSTNPRNPY
jgi:hypothetical protein